MRENNSGYVVSDERNLVPVRAHCDSLKSQDVRPRWVLASRQCTHWRVSAGHEPDQALVAIVGADELSVVARFHMNRPGEQWLGENLQAYQDAVMSIDSSVCLS